MSSYRKGYHFERRVRIFLEKSGYVVIREGKSKFPDFVCIGKVGLYMGGFPRIFFAESKVNKYLSREEKSKAKEYMDDTELRFFVFHREKNKIKWYEVKGD